MFRVTCSRQCGLASCNPISFASLDESRAEFRRRILCCMDKPECGPVKLAPEKRTPLSEFIQPLISGVEWLTSILSLMSLDLPEPKTDEEKKRRESLAGEFERMSYLLQTLDLSRGREIVFPPVQPQPEEKPDVDGGRRVEPDSAPGDVPGVDRGGDDGEPAASEPGPLKEA
jgi:hypothetical protein